MTDLFKNADTGADPLDISGDENPVELLVGEGKKFKSVEDLARGKLESDNFIKRLLDEQKTLRDELLAAKRLEEIVDKLSQKTNSTPPNDPNHTNHNGEDDKGKQTVDFDELVERALSKKEQERRQLSNIDEVQRTLTEAWGPAFAQKLVAEAAALGMSKEEVNSLAASNPKALYRLVGLEGARPTQRNDVFTPPSSNVNTTGFKPNTGERTKAYYDKLKRENPSLYFSSKIQQQEYQDAMRLGDRFFS